MHACARRRRIAEPSRTVQQAQAAGRAGEAAKNYSSRYLKLRGKQRERRNFGVHVSASAVKVQENESESGGPAPPRVPARSSVGARSGVVALDSGRPPRPISLYRRLAVSCRRNGIE
eukprot:superscaffoldBa00003442_g16954